MLIELTIFLKVIQYIVIRKSLEVGNRKSKGLGVSGGKVRR